MPIIIGADSEFRRLVVEEFNRRAQRVVELGQASPDADMDEVAGCNGRAGHQGDEGQALDSCGPGVPSRNGAAHAAGISNEELEQPRDARAVTASAAPRSSIGDTVMNGQGPLTPADLRWWMPGPWRVGTGHPASLLVRDLVPAWPDTTVTCPHCPVDGKVVSVFDHLLGEHHSGLQEVAEWLETVDADLFSLAVHRLASEARNQSEDRPIQTTPAGTPSQ